jgi:hypothetical protein
MICLLDYRFRGTQCMLKHKIRQVSVFQGDCTQEQCLFLGSNPQRHSAIVFYRYSGHLNQFSAYTFK